MKQEILKQMNKIYGDNPSWQHFLMEQLKNKFKDEVERENRRILENV